MKRSLIIVIGICCWFFVHSQKVENKTIDNLKSIEVTIDVDHSEVEIITWDKSYIEIQSSMNINDDTGNDKHELEISNSKSGVKINSNVRYDELERMVISKDKDGQKVIRPLAGFQRNENDGLNNQMQFGYDVSGSLKIYIPKDLNVNLNSTYGSIILNGRFKQLSAHSIYGLVEATLEDLSNMENLYLKATYDIVELTIDESSDANLSLHTTYGAIFTDLPIKFEQDNLIDKEKGQCKSGQYMLNKGDVNVKLSATYSNIYIRKSN